MVGDTEGSGLAFGVADGEGVLVGDGSGVGVGVTVGEGEGEGSTTGAGELIETVKIGPYHPAQNPLSRPETKIVA